MILNFLKNTFKSKIHDIKVNDETYFAYIHNHTDSTETINKPISKKYIQFYFCTKGGATLNFNEGSYKLPIMHHKAFLLYNPNNELPINLNINEKSKVFILLITVDHFHSIFMKTGEEIPFLTNENINNKFYKDFDITSNLLSILKDCEKYQLNENFKSIYYQAKIHELFVNFFYTPEVKTETHCPFLNNEETVLKIKRAKDILIENLTTPPTIKELSQKIELSEYKLKEGFKRIYGTTLFSYLLDYKLELSKNLLKNEKMSVQDVAYEIGYDNPSHFISAFKKKYNITPKKYSQ
ncbi:regulatory protein PchR [Flavobacteriaceae bacterium UJ101]|nr:regulatory protein PchR [Flavobacteriaceae bacterium UJ101]